MKKIAQAEGREKKRKDEIGLKRSKKRLIFMQRLLEKKGLNEKMSADGWLDSDNDD